MTHNYEVSNLVKCQLTAVYSLHKDIQLSGLLQKLEDGGPLVSLDKAQLLLTSQRHEAPWSAPEHASSSQSGWTGSHSADLGSAGQDTQNITQHSTTDNTAKHNYVVTTQSRYK